MKSLAFRLVSITTSIVLIFWSFYFIQTPTKVNAQVDTSPPAFINGQNYNQLVADSDFVNTGSMNAAAIQSFLSGKGSGLANVSSSQLGSGANGRSAAQIIYDASQANDSASSGTSSGVCITNDPSSCPNGDDAVQGTINPEAILITLQKEQGLITNASPTQEELDYATGYDCPGGNAFPNNSENPSCNPTYAGFTNQVGWAAWQLRWNYEQSRLNNSIVSPYIAGGTLPNMTYNVPAYNLSGSVTVYLSNNATASLYRYTPFLFNGNYNFWQLGISWFGFSTNPSGTNLGVNDTSALQAGTYGTTFVVSGTKLSSDTVTYNGQTIAGTGSTGWTLTISPSMGVNTYSVNYVNGSGGSDGSKTITIARRVEGDINGDGKINAVDLSIMLSYWGQTIPGADWSNINNPQNWVNLDPQSSSVINTIDLSIMLAHWTG